MRLIRLKYSVTNLSVFRIVSNFTGNELNKYILGVMEGFMGFGVRGKFRRIREIDCCLLLFYIFRIFEGLYELIICNDR